LFFDNFNDNTLDWDLFSDSRRVSMIRDGQLRLNVKAANESIVSLLPVELTDFDLSVTIKPEPGSATGYSIIWFRYTGAGGYVFELFSDGTFSVEAGSFSSFKPLVELQRTMAFKRNDVNHVRILARGDKFAIYINDEQVATFSDKQYSKGEIGLGAVSLRQSGVVTLFDNLVVTTPKEEVTMMPTPTTAPTKVPGTPGPKPTAPQPTTAGVSASALLNAIVKARLAAEDVGGALDRLYGGSGAEGCGPLLADYATIAKAPTFDVSAQSPNVQNAYGLYRQGVELLIVRLAPIAKVCLGGGGGIGKLDFDMARTAINDGASLLTQAQNAIGQ
jgi:hypothetical protein